MCFYIYDTTHIIYNTYVSYIYYYLFFRDVLGDIKAEGEWIGIGASFGIFNGENQFQIKNLTEQTHWISEV